MLNPLLRIPEIQIARGMRTLPITLLGGFLGAGKTTLLNSLLTQGDGRGLAVLVNDFGELNIDSRLIVKVEGQQMELANGCICCSIRDDLVAGLQQLLDSNPVPEQLLIETSGVSDPMNIVCTFNSSTIRRRIFLENVVTVVDALHALDTRDTDARELFQRQIRGAYMIVLNRVQAAGEEQTRRVRELVRELLPGASIFETADGSVPMRILLGDNRLGQQAFRPEPTADRRAHPFASMAFRSTRPFRRMEFARVMKELASTAYRAKGFVHFKNYPLTTLYQKVGSFQSYSDGTAWGVDQPRTELVLIGTMPGFDPAAITAALEACCAD